MADASTISGSSSIAIKPEPLFCDGEVDCVAVDADVLVAVVAALSVFADVVTDADEDALVPLVLLVLSGKPPANAFDALTVKAPKTSDFNRWRIDCAPQNSNNQNGIAPLNFSTPMWMTHQTVTVHRLTVR